MDQKEAIASLHASLGVGQRKARSSPAAKRKEIEAGQALVLERVLVEIRKRARITPSWAHGYNSAATVVELELAAVLATAPAPAATSGGEAVAAALTPLSQLMRLDLSDMHTKLVERMDYWMCRALSSEAASEPFGYVLQNDARADSWSLFKGGTKEQADRMRQVYPKVHMVYLAPPSLPATDAASVRNAALEEVAQLADYHLETHRHTAADNNGRASDIAFGRTACAEELGIAIRALISKEAGK